MLLTIVVVRESAVPSDNIKKLCWTRWRIQQKGMCSWWENFTRLLVLFKYSVNFE